LNERSINLKAFLELAAYFENEKKVGNLNQIYVVSSYLKSVLVQEFNTKTLCPLDFPVSCDTTIFEPSVDVFLPNFFNHYVAACLYQSWVETGAGEVASRMTAMDNATRNASDMIDELSLRYNRNRQAKITTELIEIISGYQSING
jgi:F-type H+-transporting ATPase subunit gamma